MAAPVERPQSLYKMIPIPEAQSIILANTPVLPPTEVGLQEAVGLVLAEAVTAPDPLPPFPASIKDGYAVVAADGPGDYPVVGECRAGNPGEVAVKPGSVAYITTGAPVPEGADAVVQVEDTERAKGSPTVKICSQAAAGQDIRPIGSDIAKDQVVVDAGEMIGAPEVGLLATVGTTRVKVNPIPKVAVMSTGDEVVEPSTAALGPGQVRDSNRAMLLAMVTACGARTTDMGIAIDSEGDLEGCLARAIDDGTDVLLTSGGVSMGDRDFIKPLLERKGEVHFGRVKMKPGKPLTFATVDLPSGRRMLIFALPGNPVSSFVTFHLAVAPALRKMMGWADPLPRRVHVRTSSDLKLDPVRPEYHRAKVHWGLPPGTAPGAVAGEWVAASTGGQASSRLLSAKSANALLELPQAAGVIPAGTLVSALLIDDLRACPVPSAPAITVFDGPQAQSASGC